MEAEKEGCDEDKPCKLHGARQAPHQMMAQAPRPVEVDSRSLRGSIAKARALGFKVTSLLTTEPETHHYPYHGT
jgi:hypothetical protein